MEEIISLKKLFNPSISKEETISGKVDERTLEMIAMTTPAMKRMAEESRSLLKHGMLDKKSGKMQSKKGPISVRVLGVSIPQVTLKEIKECQSEGVFESNRCYRNIRYYLNETNTRIGDIEEAAGYTKGYLSRLEKAGEKTQPGLIFLTTAAKTFGVSVDDLIYGDVGIASDEDKYIVDFIKDLITDTKSHIIHWSVDLLFVLHHSLDFVKYGKTIKSRKKATNYEDDGVQSHYSSSFFPESNVFAEYCYSAKLPKSNNRIQIVSCTADIKDQRISGKTFVEVYIADASGKVSPVCCSLKASLGTRSAIKKLYRLAKGDAMGELAVSASVRGVIDSYRSNR